MVQNNITRQYFHGSGEDNRNEEWMRLGWGNMGEGIWEEGREWKMG